MNVAVPVVPPLPSTTAASETLSAGLTFWLRRMPFATLPLGESTPLTGDESCIVNVRSAVAVVTLAVTGTLIGRLVVPAGKFRVPSVEV